MRTNNVTTAENQQERLGKQVGVKDISPEFGGYLAGFVDGEGSFNISLRKKHDYAYRWQPVLSFNVSQKEKTLLILLKQTLRCGIIKQRKDGLYSYDVTTPLELQKQVIPFFQTFQFLSQRKQSNILLFSRAVDLMVRKEHLTKTGLRKLLFIREIINTGKGRTRKYTLQDVFPESSETIRQAPPQAEKR